MVARVGIPKQEKGNLRRLWDLDQWMDVDGRVTWDLNQWMDVDGRVTWDLNQWIDVVCWWEGHVGFEPVDGCW